MVSVWLSNSSITHALIQGFELDPLNIYPTHDGIPHPECPTFKGSECPTQALLVILLNHLPLPGPLPQDSQF